MEFNIDDFTARLLELLRDNVPNEDAEISKSKHSNRGGRQLKDLFSESYSKESGMLPDSFNATISMNIDTRVFEVGSPMVELLMPHYHILQQAETIRKRNRGTKKSKGSQDSVKKMDRDYERVIWNGKTYSKEYSKNVRGSRSKANKILEPKLRYSGGQYYEDKRGIGGSYVNVHYKYIDRILDATVPYLADEFGLRAYRKQDTGLKEEYEYQDSIEQEDRFGILDIFGSFDFDEGEELWKTFQ